MPRPAAQRCFFQARVETAASTPDVQRMASPHVSAVLLFIRLSVSCWHAKELQNRSRFGGCCNGQHNDLHGYGKIPLRQILNQRRAHRSNAVVQPQLEHGAKRCQLSTGRTADAVRSWASRCPPPGRISGGTPSLAAGTTPIQRPGSGSGTTHTSTMWLKPDSATSPPERGEILHQGSWR